MRTKVSIPDPIFEAAEVLACRLGISRSALYTLALSRELARHGDDVTSELDAVYGGVADCLARDEAWVGAGSKALLASW